MAEQNYRVFFDEAMKQIHAEYKAAGKENEFILWFKVSYVEDTISEITVSVASEFMRQQMDSRNVTSKIEQKIQELTGQSIKLKYVLHNESSKIEETVQSTQINDIQSVQKKTEFEEIAPPEIGRAHV